MPNDTEAVATNVTDPIEVRYAKLEEAKSKGINPYAYTFDREHEANLLQEKYKDLADGSETEDMVAVAGRITAMRNNGMFIDLADASGKIQIFSHKDSTPVEDPKDPESCSVFDLYKLFATQAQQDELAAKYRSSGMGYGEAKKTLYEAAMDHFGEARERREQLEKDPDTVESILQQGARQAREIGRVVLDRVRSACGIAAN